MRRHSAVILACALVPLALNLAATGPERPRTDPAVPQVQPAKTLSRLAIVGGRLIDGFGGLPLESSVILVEGNRIQAVGQAGRLAVPPGTRVIQADGMAVLPGLWESHGHLQHVGEARPNEFPEKYRARLPEIMAAVAEQTLMAGVTSFRDTGGPLEPQLALRADIEAGRRPGPRLYLAGPILNQTTRTTTRREGDLSIGDEHEARATVERLAAMKVDQIKVYSFWDQPVLDALVQAAHRVGLGVDADVRHIDAYRTAVRARVDRLHHVFAADPLSDYSEDDLRLLVRGERPAAVGPFGNILRGPYIIPTVEMRQAYVRVLRFPGLLEHPRLVSRFAPDVGDYLRETWRDPQSIPWGIGAVERVKVIRRKLGRFIEAGGREQVVAGCDAGSPLNFHSPLARELANLVEAGLTPIEAIQSATLRPAQMQGRDRELGTISAGKLADLIVVDGDPLEDITALQWGVVHVIKDGRQYK